MTTSQDLLEARNYIRDNGWVQRWYHGKKDEPNAEAACITGAMMRVAGVPRLEMPNYSNPRVIAMREVFAVANSINVSGDSGIAQWNDTPGRTAAQVDAAFNLAILHARRLERSF